MASLERYELSRQFPDLLPKQGSHFSLLSTVTDMEQMMGIEPTSPAWKAGVLAIELHPQWLQGEDLHLRPSAYETDELLLLPPRNE